MPTSYQSEVHVEDGRAANVLRFTTRPKPSPPSLT